MLNTTTETPPQCLTCGHPKKLTGNGSGYWRCYRCRPSGRTRKGRVVEHLNGHAAVQTSITTTPNQPEVHHEIGAMAIVSTNLLALEPEARARVWAWLASRFGTS
jgi:tRNA(Ile2) C34 agmatinyltransferase TiaS